MNFAAYKFFVDGVSKITHVSAVYAVVEEGVIDLWTIVEDNFYEAESRVIESEINLLQKFPSLSFDFMIIPKDARKLQEIIPSNSVQIYRCPERTSQ